MNNTQEINLSITETYIYKMMLNIYPLQYRKKFSNEMILTFEDMYREEMNKYGRIRLQFWVLLLIDTVKSALKEHSEMMNKQGIKKYFHINRYNLIGSILLTPSLLLFLFDLIGRITQGNLFSYNRQFYRIISQTFIYKDIRILWLILIGAPLLAVLINLLPFIFQIFSRPNFVKKIIFTNVLTIILVLFGSFCLLIVFAHDFIPCLIHGIFLHGFKEMNQLISVCNNA